VLQEGQLVYSRNHGLASLEHESPLTADSLFYLASVSKQFTAACILKLIHDKQLKLGHDARALIKEIDHFPHKISIQNLLNHTSGIPDYFEYFNCHLGRHHSDYFDNADIMKVISGFFTTRFKPNERMSYSNSNYIILAQVVKKVSGLTLAKFAKKHIFGPTGMKHTIFDEDRFKVVKHRVSGYERASEKSRIYRLDLKNSTTVGDGGVLSSINDLIQWELNFHKNTHLDVSVIRGLTKRCKLANGTPNAYGNGLELSTEEDKNVFSYHGGGFDGFRTWLARVPAEKISLIYLSFVE